MACGPPAERWAFDRSGRFGIFMWASSAAAFPGMDFADALYLASCRMAESFLTFDRGLGKTASLLAGEPAVRVL